MKPVQAPTKWDASNLYVIWPGTIRHHDNTEMHAYKFKTTRYENFCGKNKVARFMPQHVQILNDHQTYFSVPKLPN